MSIPKLLIGIILIVVFGYGLFSCVTTLTLMRSQIKAEEVLFLKIWIVIDVIVVVLSIVLIIFTISRR